MEDIIEIRIEVEIITIDIVKVLLVVYSVAYLVVCSQIVGVKF